MPNKKNKTFATLGIISGLFAVALTAVSLEFASAQTSTTATSSISSFTRNLRRAVVGEDVRQLQRILNMNPLTQVATIGAGAPGSETTYFGTRTYNAVIRFQNLYRNDILAPLGLNTGTGFVGTSTRAKLNSILAPGGTTTPPPGTGTTTPPVTGTGTLALYPANQPASSLAPENAARVPFTRFTLTANNGPVVVNGVTVERTGLAQDAVFSGVALLDENGNQIGISKTLNANHQATVGENNMIINAGQTRTFTVAGNMAANLDPFQGQVVGLNVISINSSSAITGSLPISGAQNTVNSTLSLGSATLAISSFDPNTSSQRQIGTTGFRFAGVRITAGSQEGAKLMSIRWNQSGSASSNDISNVKVFVDGTSYDTVLSSDGKYYTANFSTGGILIEKGFSKDVYIQGDIAGAGAANRTVKFDIYRNTDIYLLGNVYGYGIIPTALTTATASNASSEFTTGTPFFDASQITISAGSVTTISRASSIQAQNVGVNVPNQILGGFDINVVGEQLSVQNIIFTATSTATTSTALLRNVSIFDENGAVVAGPVDETSTGTLTFSNTVTFPTGTHTYTLRGTVPAEWPTGTQVTLSTNPGTQWTNITGQISGNNITLTNAAITLAQMTVRGAGLAVGVSPSPAAQSIVAGNQNVVFANYQLDASTAGEDIRLSSLPTQLTLGGGATGNSLNSCQLYDGNTAVTTGTNVVNPSGTGTTTQAFTFDNSIVVPRGTVKTLSLKCSVTSSATGTFAWGIASGANVVATGVGSSSTATVTINASTGQVMTIGTSSFTVSEDPSSPSYTVAAGGSTNVTLGILRLRSAGEDLRLTDIALQLTGTTATSSAADLAGNQVTLWDGSTQVGTAVFSGTSRTTTATLSGTFNIPRDTDKQLIIKGNIAQIGPSQSGTSGHLIQIDYNGDNASSTRAVGGASGSVTSGTTADTSIAGVRIFRSYPTFAQDTLPSSGVSDGRLLRFRVTANSNGDVGIAKFTLGVSPTNATVTNVNIFGYTDSSYSQSISGVSGNGQMSSSNITPSGGIAEVYAETSGGATTTVQIPAGQTRYFEARASIAGTASNFNVTTTIQGDNVFPNIATLMGTVTQVDAATSDNFIWSPNTNGQAVTSDTDWTNGFGLPGLPQSGIIQTRSD